MFKINENYNRLTDSYLFSTIAHKVDAYLNNNPDADLIRLGIGDVTLPLAKSVVEAMTNAVCQMGERSSFRGYGPEQGYDFLRKAISDHDYAARGVDISPDEIFISDGAKSDIANILDIIGLDNSVALTDPVYPVYLDSNIMAGRTTDLHDKSRPKIVKLPCMACNGFVPQLPDKPVDIIYLCYPNNPTGTTLTREQMKAWVNYACKNGALIIYDSAYEAYITEDDIPHSIYEIEHAKRVAIEIRSFSKTAGFTGVRCGYTVVPNELAGLSNDGKSIKLNRLWNRRQTTKFNGASYISQCGAFATYSSRGREEIQQSIRYYMSNARKLREALRDRGFEVAGGINAPYIWLRAPEGMSSWQMFELLLQQCQIVVTPGIGFGSEGDGYIRLTAFNTHENTCRAIERLNSLII